MSAVSPAHNTAGSLDVTPSHSVVDDDVSLILRKNSLGDAGHLIRLDAEF